MYYFWQAYPSYLHICVPFCFIVATIICCKATTLIVYINGTRGVYFVHSLANFYADLWNLWCYKALNNHNQSHFLDMLLRDHANECAFKIFINIKFNWFFDSVSKNQMKSIHLKIERNDIEAKNWNQFYYYFLNIITYHVFNAFVSFLVKNNNWKRFGSKLLYYSTQIMSMIKTIVFSSWVTTIVIRKFRNGRINF